MIARPLTSRLRLRLAGPTLLLCAVIVACAAAPAFAESPWWHLTSGSRPSYLHPGQAQSEVQEVTVKGTAGESFILGNLTKEQVQKEEFENGAGEARFAFLEVGAQPSTIQVALEAPALYGAGNVEVTGGPGAPLGSEPYVIKFIGTLLDQPVRLINTELNALSGLAATVDVSETTRGRPDGEIYVTAENLGDASISGTKTPVQLKDVLPAGLKAVGVVGTKPFKEGNFQEREAIPCTLETLTCTLGAGLAPYDQIEMRIAVLADGAAVSGEQNEVSVSGGNAQPASLKRPITVSSVPVPFGVEGYEMGLEEEGGATTQQAGSHPFQLTTTITLNQNADIKPLQSPGFKPEVTVPALAKDLSFRLPPGLIGNPTAIPQCTTAQFYETVEGKENKCPAASAVGVATATVHEPATVGTATLTEPIFNLEPRVGEPARFGFYVVIANSPVFIDTSVRSGGDYGVNVTVSNITQTAAFLSSEVTFWGVPGDPRHDKQRGWGCLYEARNVTPHAPCAAENEQHPRPFLTLPSSCSSTLQSSVEGDSWASPGSFFSFLGEFDPTHALVGCNRLQFAPEAKVIPDSQEASRPTGMAVNIHVPQEANENAQGLASSNVKAITVTFPEGVTLNPSAAGWIQACTESQVGFLNARGAAEELLFTPTLPEAFCPDASKVGTVKIRTPLLPAGQLLEGGLYLAAPAPQGEDGQNPFNSLVAMYIVARDPVSGVLVKLPGSVLLDQGTGRITSTFQNTPDLPFEDAEVHLFGGERAPLATPATCGTKTTEATFTPWSGTAPIKSSSSFTITSGPGGTPCPSSPPFSPSLSAGTTNVNAGAFSPLSTTINREDGSQDIHSVQLRTPPGLSGILTGVRLCAEAQANAGNCTSESLIGHSTVSVGLGADPFAVTGGQVFLTEGYKGAPFGLSIVTPAIAGPFNLGLVIVRAKIEVDPHTAQLTVTTDGSGPYAIPRILDGIPLQLRHVNVTIDRRGFTFNPTSCNPLSVTGSIQSYEGASASVSSPFQAASCRTLRFAPKFTVSTSGKTSKANGASLTVKLAYPAGSLGTQANIAKVKVSLPKQLPSRLTTLQKACVASVFDTNPANCPKESIVGHATVHTPALPVVLDGPAYFVSHGGEAFPDLTLVLQGYGLTIDLVGSTQIKNGITTSTFKATPDVPFSSFELSLPRGKFSVLTANAKLCGAKLLMPTAFTAQNGAEVHQSTKIAVNGCKPAPTMKQKLAKALKACRNKKNHSRRSSCEAQSRKRFGVTKAKGSPKR